MSNILKKKSFEGATFHDETFNAQSNTTCLIHSDLFTVLKKVLINHTKVVFLQQNQSTQI